MNFSTIKKLCLTSAVALTMFASQGAFAQSTATANVPASFSTAAGITAAAVNTLTFGTWLVVVGGADTPTITIPAGSGAPSVPTPTNASSSTVSNVVAPTTRGSATVTSPVTGTVYLTAAVTDFTNVNLTLSAPTYSVGGSPSAAIPTTGTTAPIATTASVATTVDIGGTITIGNAGLPFNTSFTDGVINLTFTL